MFTVEERDRVRERLLELAKVDPDVVGAAITGSYAAGRSDEWSDIDLAFGIDGALAHALERWQEILYRDFGAVHDWDLPWESTIYRVFLLPEWLQVDILFMPAAQFGPRGPDWRTVFGTTVDLQPPQRSADDLIGWGWVYARHARVCLDREKLWQAEWCISSLRDNILALASFRYGLPIRYAKSADSLPEEFKARLESTLVLSLGKTELRRALDAVLEAFALELEHHDANLAAKLGPMLSALR